MTFSSVGRKLFAALGAILLVNIIVLALSARVNDFQEFFFIADLFPLALSIVTLVVIVSMLALDVSLQNSFTARPPFIIGIMSVLSIFWLAFNAFSTSRWRHVPLVCSSIPAEYTDEKIWCHDLQALKAFIWIEWVMMTFTVLVVTRYVITQHSRGQTHVLSTPLSRFAPRHGAFGGGMGRGSDFLQYEENRY